MFLCWKRESVKLLSENVPPHFGASNEEQTPSSLTPTSSSFVQRRTVCTVEIIQNLGSAERKTLRGSEQREAPLLRSPRILHADDKWWRGFIAAGGGGGGGRPCGSFVRKSRESRGERERVLSLGFDRDGMLAEEERENYENRNCDLISIFIFRGFCLRGRWEKAEPDLLLWGAQKSAR